MKPWFQTSSDFWKMTDYLQPQFYRFNEDSIRLLRYAESGDTILDLCSGCGVIGLEAAQKLRPRRLVLVELQEDFLPYLRANVATFYPAEIVISSMSEWQSGEKFDLILCNPPYYLPGRGERSKDERRHLARTFERDGWKVLLKTIRDHLAPGGKGLVVVRNDPGIRKEIGEAKILEETDLLVLQIK